MKKFTLDEKVLNQVVSANKDYSSFGIENSPNKIDYIHLYVMDMDDNVIATDYLSQDKISIVDNRVVDLDIGQHLRDLGYTEGEYKVKYYFLSALAGLPTNANYQNEPGYYYLKPNQKPYTGLVMKEMRNNKEFCYYLNSDGTEKIPLKKIENKYILLDMSSDKKEVVIDTQNIDDNIYKGNLRHMLRQLPTPRFNYAYNLGRSYSMNQDFPPARLQFDQNDPSIINLIPQWDGDPGFDNEIIGKPITIKNVYQFQGPEASFQRPPNANDLNPNDVNQAAMFAGSVEDIGEAIQDLIDNSGLDAIEEFRSNLLNMDYIGNVIEVLDYNKIRVDTTVEQGEEKARLSIRNALDYMNDIGLNQISIYTADDKLKGELYIGDGVYSEKLELTAESLTQIKDLNRILIPVIDYSINRTGGESWVVWTPQTDLERLNTYMVVNNEYYLIANASEGYGRDGTIYGGQPLKAPNNVLKRYFRFYTPLENSVEKYDLVYFVEEKLEPYEDKIKLIPFVNSFDENLQFLRIPNTNSVDNPIRSRNTNFKTLSEIKPNDSNTSDKIDSKIFSSSLADVTLNVEYGKRSTPQGENNDYGFQKFIQYGSAEKRLKNFKSKLLLIESYTSQSNAIANISSSAGDVIQYRNLKNNVINSFDHFEHFMYYESSSYVTSSIGETYSLAWPKTSYSNNEYTLAPVTSSIAISHYDSWLGRAQIYDNWNPEKLTTNLPSHIKEDSNNSVFLDFFDMAGHQFDEIWMYIRHFTDLNERTSRLGEGISKDLAEEVGKSLGLKLFNGNDLLELPQYLFGVNSDGSSVYSNSQEDVTKEIHKRILATLPFLSRTKGTIRSIKALLNCYGIPSSILRVREYGGPDVNNRTSHEIKRKFTYALEFDKAHYVQHSWKQDSVDNIYPTTVQFRFKTNHSVGNSGSMAIVQTTDRWAIGLKDNGTTDSYGNLFFALSGSNSSAVSCSIDNLPFYNNDMWSVMLTRASSSGADLTNNSPDSKVKYELTAKQYDATREIILYQSSSFLIADGSGGNNTDGYEQNEYWTTATNTRLGGNSNGKFGSMFSGSLMEYRLWTEPLNQTAFDNHVRAPKSYNGNTTSSYYDKLVFKLPLNDNIVLNNSVTLDDKSARTSYEAEASTNGFGGSNKFKSLVDKEELKVPNIGPQRRNATKIRIENNQLGNRQLSPDIRVEQSAFDNAPLDSNKLGIYFSPVDVVNEDIMYSLADFDFNDLVGDPRDEFELEFRGLEKTQRDYWKKYSSPNNFFDYLRILQYYDSGIFDQLRTFIPAKANPTLGVLIEPNILERNKEVVGKLPEIETPYYENAGQFDEGLQISNNKSGSDAAYNIGGEFYQTEGTLNATGYGPEAGANGSLGINTLNVLDQYDPKGPFGNTYLSASITHGGSITEFVEATQPVIDSSRISKHSQVKRKFYNSELNASLDIPYSASFHPSEFESMAVDSTLFRVYYKPVTLTKKNTIDGKEPVEITITSPTRLISKEPGDSKLIVD